MKQTFHITLEGDDDATPAIIRLRQALKLLLRACRLRCVEAREVQTGLEVRGEQGAGGEKPNLGSVFECEVPS